MVLCDHFWERQHINHKGCANELKQISQDKDGASPGNFIWHAVMIPSGSFERYQALVCRSLADAIVTWNQIIDFGITALLCCALGVGIVYINQYVCTRGRSSEEKIFRAACYAHKWISSRRYLAVTSIITNHPLLFCFFCLCFQNFKFKIESEIDI